MLQVALIILNGKNDRRGSGLVVNVLDLWPIGLGLETAEKERRNKQKSHTFNRWTNLVT